MEMEDSQEIEAARKILAGSSAEMGGGFGSKLKESRGLGNESEDNQVKQVTSSDMNRDDDDDSVGKKRVVDTELVVETSFEVEDGNNASNGDFGKEKKLGDNENGGVSGSDYKQSNGTVFEDDENGGQTGEEEEEEKIDLNASKYLFRVGDLVWAKIRSHPWWPGQIYDPSDASEFAEKHSYARQGGRLLVAFFGDGSCSWCLPSQLIPFTEHFKEMSTDSSSRSFLNALHSAVDEVGRLVESNMMCKCIGEEYKVGLCRKPVVNAGIKEGVFVPEVDVDRLSVPTYEPVEILARLRHAAVEVSVGSMIEFVVLKSWISAFYRWKGGFCLPVYKEPDFVEGLEDKSGIAVKNMDVNVNTNDFSVPIEVPIGPVGDESVVGPTLGGGDSVGPTNGRKQKSVAELMKDNPEVELKSKRRVTDSGKSTSAKKRKSDDRGGSDGGASSRVKSVLGKRKAEEVLNVATNEVAGEVGKDDRPTEKNGFADGETTMVSSPRERKKSKYLSPPYTNLNWREGSSSFKKGSEARPEKNTEIAREEDIPLKKFPRKQQKELDTPGNESQTVEDAEKSEAVEETEKSEAVEDTEKSETEKRETDEDTEDIVFTSAVDVSVKDVLSEIQFAAVDHVDFSKTSSLVTVMEFSSAFRSLIYSHGSNSNMFHKVRPGVKKKSKSLLSKPDNRGNGLTPTKPKSAGPKLTSLILTFPPESTLPSKDEIIQLFSRFGNLNEAETCVIPDSNSAKVVYTNDVSAKEAFKSSVNESLFGDQIVNYKLQHSSTESRSRGSQTRISSQQTPKKKTASSKLAADVVGIREKLETMEAMLENCSNKISAKDKSSLKDEIKSLSEKVETAVEKVKKVVESKSS